MMSPDDTDRTPSRSPVASDWAPNGHQAPPGLHRNGASPARSERSALRSDTISVAVLNDAELIVRGVAAMLAEFADRVRVVEIDANGLPDEPVEVALLDTFAAGIRAADRAETILDLNLAKHIVLYTWDVHRMTTEMMDLPRVNGVVSKAASSAQLVQAIEDVVAGHDVVINGPTPHGGSELSPVEPLSDREAQVASLMAQGCTNREIATALVVSPETVKTYATRLFRKLGARNRAQVAAWVVDGGLSQAERHRHG